MSKHSPLSIAVHYSKKRIKSVDASLDSFITTDNILPNKSGVAKASNLPPSGNSMPAYKQNDILIGNIRPYLKKIWFASKNGGCSPDVLVFEVKKGYCPKFVYYNLFQDTFFKHMMKGSKGTKMPRGDTCQILDFMIPIYPLPIQKKISSVLSTLDAKIEINNRINAELEALAKTLYDYWFVQFDFPDENGKPYKSSGGKMVYNQKLKREIPFGWKDASLWDIAEYYNGLALQKYRPSSEKFLRVIKIKEMGEGFSEKSEKAKIDIPSQAIVKNGDVLFSWSATLEVQVWSKGIGALNQHIFKVSSKNYPRTYYYFEIRNYLNHFKMMADKRKTTMGHITQDHLKQSCICHPPIKLINKLHNKIDPIIEMQLALNKENEKLAELRDWLLPMLMNGQVNIG